MTLLSIPGTTCLHIQSELQDNNLVAEELKAKYKNVLQWNVHRSQAVRASFKRRKVAPPSCGTCGIALARPFACLNCEYAGCWDDGHAAEHLRNTEHRFFADVKTGAVYCSECEDFIYDSTMDELRADAIVEAEEKHTRFQVSQKPRDPYVRWVPHDKDNAAMESFTPLACQGRRGLVNLGQTCYLNVILQSLVHNPLLRHYFLADKHNFRQCKLEHCTCCEMDKLFTEVYSEEDSPYAPASFLHTLWKTSAELSGYAQHDAHETFIATLNQIHSTSRGSTNVSCNCIIHNAFGGQLQSDVKCERCGNITTAVDPILDISLELPSAKSSGTGKAGSSSDSLHPSNMLAACLRKFTQPEKLDAKEYSCTKCAKVTHAASKRMSIRQLPAVLSFQFKRFEQKTNDKTSARKLDTPVRIPASMNMAAYTSTLVKEMEKENAGPGTGVPFVYPGPEVLYEYDLFAVICHHGQIDNGHYINYARFEDEWYCFDDDKVTHSNLAECLNSNPYMCFYVKRHLDYKQYMTPSYVLVQKHEAEKEAKEKEMKGRAKEVKEVKERRPKEGVAAAATPVVPAPPVLEMEQEMDGEMEEVEEGEEGELDEDADMEEVDGDGEEVGEDDDAMMREIDDALLETL
ncbi:hypothetical protein BKA70DRAFT_1400237 [Coprinopsis sp. MPI-PUGE-AT-0042]|nr:hypothetical protein BKA70DRAFT_1400237 [Coprinopsis sp. MPI-PUGE-AT-0042]